MIITGNRQNYIYIYIIIYDVASILIILMVDLVKQISYNKYGVVSDLTFLSHGLNYKAVTQYITCIMDMDMKVLVRSYIVE